MNRPRFHPSESSAYNFRQQPAKPTQNDLHGFVSYPSRYYNRPPRPTDCSTSAVRSDMPQWPAAVKSKPDFQTNQADFASSFPNKSAQQQTVDNAAKKNASEDHVTPVSVAATSSGTADDIEQLKWQAGQGPTVCLRLLVPGRVCETMYRVVQKSDTSVLILR